MSKSLSIIAAVLAGLAVAGCAAPWTGDKPAATGLTNQTAIGPRRPCDMRQLQDVMAELHQSGTIDPAAEEQLAKDLQQSDPAIWPLVIQQCRATQAYRCEAARRNGASDIVQRLPPTGGAALPTGGVPQGAYPSTSVPAAGDVMQASFSASLGEWRQRLNGAIEALEAETSANPPTPGDVTEEARLRLLYTVAGRREDAARPILDAAPATQQFLSKEVEGLGVWLDAEHVPDPVRRTVEAKPALTAALAHLGETAPLMVRNASFCSEALGFGSFKKVEKYEFCQDQNVLLYAELVNYSAEPVDKGFRTSLRSGYQILDYLGRQVAWREFPPTQDFCKNVRRDFFIAFHLRLPNKMAPGKYLLRLVIQDTMRQKTGQASVEFTVKEGKADDGKKKEKKEEKKER
ncbi:MAG: hypothetical protein WCB27_03985 [Thermoguttaceae bacterium]